MNPTLPRYPVFERELMVPWRPSERKRALLASLCLWLFALLPIEGVLRKWLLNGIEQVFVFIRDPVALAILLLYLVYRQGRIPMWLVIWTVVVFGFLILSMVQAAELRLPLLLFVIGLRNYFLFVPVAFVAAEVLRAKDIRGFLVTWAYLSVPIALLVIVQFFSSPTAYINRGVEDGRVFTVSADRVRTYGLFSFVVGQTQFASLMTALSVISFDRRKALRLAWRIPVMTIGSTIVMIALSGSRTTFVMSGLIVLAYVLGNFAGKNIGRGVLQTFGAAIGVMLFLLVFVFVFPESFEAMTTRQTEAVAAEGSTLDRALSSLSPVPASGPGLTVLGEGIGLGTNAGGAVITTGQRTFLLSENEVPRVFQETGVLGGGVVMGLRFFILMWLLALCARTARVHNVVAPFAMLGFVAPDLMVAQVTGQSQILSFCWFSVGLCAALTRSDAFALTGTGQRVSVPLRRPEMMERGSLRPVESAEP